MPDPTPAAYHLFSWMRQGLLAGITDATGSGNTSAPGHLVLTVCLRINDTHDVSSKSTGADAVVRDLFIIGIPPQISAHRWENKRMNPSESEKREWGSKQRGVTNRTLTGAVDVPDGRRRRIREVSEVRCASSLPARALRRWPSPRAGPSSFGSQLSLANDAASDDRSIKRIERMETPGCWKPWVPMQLWTRTVQAHVMGR
jgi:hypothetical protein